MTDDNVQQRIDLGGVFIPFELYGELIKGKQTFLLMFTALFTYLISGYPNKYDLGNAFTLIFGLFFAIAGSTLLNMYIDRDIDQIMERTKDRALPSGRISPKSVLWHGIVFSVFGVIVTMFVNRLTGLVVFGGLFFDVVVYSILLKRKTKWSIIFGGISGGMPALAGRTAVINQVDIVGILFLLFILLWIPMHILTLATLPKNLKGYSEAGVPMWPVEAGVDETRTVITISAFIDGLIIFATGYFININIIAQIPTIIMALVMIYLAIKNFREPNHENTFVLFKFASIFMMLVYMWLFVALLITPKLDNLINIIGNYFS